MVRRWIKDFVHNSLVHPTLPFLPTAWGDALHDRNAAWAFGQTDTNAQVEELRERLARVRAEAERLGTNLHWPIGQEPGRVFRDRILRVLDS